MQAHEVFGREHGFATLGAAVHIGLIAFDGWEFRTALDGGYVESYQHDGASFHCDADAAD